MTEQTNENQNNSPASVRKIKLPIKHIKIGAIVVLVLVVLYLLRGMFVAATVNGVPVLRMKVLQLSEQAQGASVLDSLITEILIAQEAEKQNITVTEDEISEELTGIEDTLTQQGITLEDALSQRKMTREQLIEQLTLQKKLEKMLLQNITVTDEEVDQYMKDNEKYLPENKDTPEFKEQVRQEIQQQKLGTEYQTWVQNVKNKSKINYFVNY